MSTENTQDKSATEGCAAAAGYVAALENALYAAIVALYSTDKEDCVNTFTFDELSMVVDKTRNMPAGTRLEHIYAKALRYPHTHSYPTAMTCTHQLARARQQDTCHLCGFDLRGGSDQRLVIESIDLDDMDDDEPDDTCPECGGSGTDRYNDHILECPKCDGEGTL